MDKALKELLRIKIGYFVSFRIFFVNIDEIKNI